MAELTKEMIKAAIKIELLKEFTKPGEDRTEIPGQLPDYMEKHLDAIATGFANAFKTWQLSQSVLIIPPGVTSPPPLYQAAGLSPAGSLPLTP